MRIRAILVAPLAILACWLAGPATAQATTPSYPAPAPARAENGEVCETANSLYQNLLDPQFYYRCDRTKVATIATCPRGTIFDAYTYVCNSPAEIRPLGDRRLTAHEAVFRVVGSGGITEFSATVTEADGETPIAGTGVTFSLQSGTLMCKATTNARGVASCAPDSDLLDSIGHLLSSKYLAATTSPDPDPEVDGGVTHAVPGKITKSLL